MKRLEKNRAFRGHNTHKYTFFPLSKCENSWGFQLKKMLWTIYVPCSHMWRFSEWQHIIAWCRSWTIWNPMVQVQNFASVSPVNCLICWEIRRLQISWKVFIMYQRDELCHEIRIIPAQPNMTMKIVDVAANKARCRSTQDTTPGEQPIGGWPSGKRLAF